MENKSKTSKAKKLFQKQELIVLIAFLFVFVIANVAPIHAQTGFSSTTNINDLGVNHVRIWMPGVSQWEFSSTNSDIIKTNIMAATPEASNVDPSLTFPTIAYHGTFNWGTKNAGSDNDAVTGTTNIPGSFTLRGPFATLYDGTPADVILTFSDWKKTAMVSKPQRPIKSRAP